MENPSLKPNCRSDVKRLDLYLRRIHFSSILLRFGARVMGLSGFGIGILMRPGITNILPLPTFKLPQLRMRSAQGTCACGINRSLDPGQCYIKGVYREEGMQLSLLRSLSFFCSLSQKRKLEEQRKKEGSN